MIAKYKQTDLIFPNYPKDCALAKHLSERYGNAQLKQMIVTLGKHRAEIAAHYNIDIQINLATFSTDWVVDKIIEFMGGQQQAQQAEGQEAQQQMQLNQQQAETDQAASEQEMQKSQLEAEMEIEKESAKAELEQQKGQLQMAIMEKKSKGAPERK